MSAVHTCPLTAHPVLPPSLTAARHEQPPFKMSGEEAGGYEIATMKWKYSWLLGESSSGSALCARARFPLLFRGSPGAKLTSCIPMASGCFFLQFPKTTKMLLLGPGTTDWKEMQTQVH